MKKIITIVLLALSIHGSAQENGGGKAFHQAWTFIYDQNGNPLASENAAQGKYYLKTVFNFTSDSKYEFSLDEFDSAGTKLTQVTEGGTYALTATQFTLTPKSSETVFNPSAKQNLRSALATRIANPLTPAVYNWMIEKNKTGSMGWLSITAIKPGYREGIFSSAAAGHTKGYRQLPPDKRKAIARSM